MRKTKSSKHPGKQLCAQQVADLANVLIEKGSAALPTTGSIAKASLKKVCDSLVIHCPKSYTQEEMEDVLKIGVEAGVAVPELFPPSAVIKPPTVKPVLEAAFLELKDLEQGKSKKAPLKKSISAPRVTSSPEQSKV